MTYKYAIEMDSLGNCPPASVTPCDMQAYRFVHEEITDERNFKCICKLTPSRKLKPEDRCSALALSLFVSQEKALTRFKKLKSIHKNIEKTLGSRLAAGVIRPDDGRMSHPSGHGHFDLWEADGVDFVARFEIIADLTR